MYLLYWTIFECVILANTKLSLKSSSIFKVCL